jgi:hypothetical protein
METSSCCQIPVKNENAVTSCFNSLINYLAVFSLISGKEIQQRWRNLRTCFKRELNKQSKGKSGQAEGKRRK